jgi:hypothetical protein
MRRFLNAGSMVCSKLPLLQQLGVTFLAGTDAGFLNSYEVAPSSWWRPVRGGAQFVVYRRSICSKRGSSRRRS